MTQVLVVDDDQGIREMLRIVLEDAGYTITEAQDGAAALRVLRDSSSGMVVLLDLLMPGMDGAAMLRAVGSDNRLAARHTFIVMTANGPRIYPALAELPSDLSAATLVVHKPFPVDGLLYFVEEAARRVNDQPPTTGDAE